MTALTFTQTYIIEIHIVRHSNWYFYSRRVNDVAEVFGESITSQRAADLITMYQADDQVDISKRGCIHFEPDTAAEFSFIAEMMIHE